MYKKSQAAMEFLMTYGWALLIILIVIGALAFFGILNPDRFLPDKADAGVGVHVVDSVVNENSVTLLVSNVQGKTIQDFQLNVTACNNYEGALSNPITLLPDETAEVIVSCNHNLPASSSLKSDLKASYSVTTSGVSLPHVSSGELKASIASGESGFRALWVANGTGSSSESGNGLAVDSNGDIYVTGYSQSDLDFGNGVSFENSAGLDTFLVKYNSAGVAQWVANGTGSSSDVSNDIAIDSSDNIYIAGYSAGDLDFGNGVSFTNSGSNDFFVVKYNSAGVAQWVANGTGSSNDRARSIFIDSSDNIYVSGYSQSDLDLGNGISFTNSLNIDVFVAKYNSAGIPQWVANGTGTSTDSGEGVAVDSNGNVYVTGYSSSNLDFGNGASYSNSGSSDIFVVKYNSSGIAQWVANGTGSSDDRAYAIAVDGSGNSYITGYSSGSVDFGNGVSFSSSSNTNIFVVKYNSLGVAQWVANSTGTGSIGAFGSDISIVNNDIYVVGYSDGDTDLGNGVSFTNSDNDDIFVAKYDSSGVAQWVSSVSSTGYDYGNSIFVGNSGDVYITGSSDDDLNFGNGINYTNSGGNDFFVTKYDVD